MRLEDLPPAMQAQVREKAGIPSKAKRSRSGDSSVHISGVCWECGERFTHLPTWERHTRDNPGHRRLELIAERTAA